MKRIATFTTMIVASAVLGVGGVAAAATTSAAPAPQQITAVAAAETTAATYARLSRSTSQAAAQKAFLALTPAQRVAVGKYAVSRFQALKITKENSSFKRTTAAAIAKHDGVSVNAVTNGHTLNCYSGTVTYHGTDVTFFRARWWVGLNWCALNGGITYGHQFDQGCSINVPLWSCHLNTTADRNLGWEFRTVARQGFRYGYKDFSWNQQRCAQFRGGAQEPNALYSYSSSCDL